MVVQNALTEFLKRRKEHPALHSYHCNHAFSHRHVEIALDEHSKEIRLAVGVIVLCECPQPCIHALAAHVQRVGDDHVVFWAEVICLFQDLAHFLVGGDECQVAG